MYRIGEQGELIQIDNIQMKMKMGKIAIFLVIGINQEESENNKQCRKSIVGPVISVLSKVFCVAHSDLNETDVSRDAIFERFRGIKYLILIFFFK